MSPKIKWSRPQGLGLIAVGEHPKAIIQIRSKRDRITGEKAYEALVYLKGKNIPQAITQRTVQATQSAVAKFLNSVPSGE